jgi:hypothetical protein
MSKFKFDPNNSPDENIANFFVHLKAHDAEMTDILLKNLSKIHPVPDASERTAARKLFSNHVTAGLLALQSTKEKPV